MNGLKLEIKLAYITGLRDVVLKEINKNPNLNIIKENTDSVYLEFAPEYLQDIKRMRSVSRAYIVVQDTKYNPSYISKHKSILGNLIEIVTNDNKDRFKSFKFAVLQSIYTKCMGLLKKKMRI